MNLIFRLFRVLLAGLFRSKVGFLDESVVSFRVLPNDLDFNLHMNNGRYLTIMDLGRFDLMQRSGLTGIAIKNRWMPVVASQVINYRRSLAPFQLYSLHSRILGWDERFVYFLQQFRSDGKLAASALVKAGIVANGKSLTIEEMLPLVGYMGPKPLLSPEVTAWRGTEEWLRSGADG
ncbi:thioesterase family protein [Pelagibius sp. Alg239-R121]|uniref:thioesterase family protein n=1 Tax=Pelagibius sp. Alg239-R121 TaxID=2993448 RepID=UPI0024A6B4AA|nr:thioesterase family protein [Pelagibius sp. Alg239-R121]